MTKRPRNQPKVSGRKFTALMEQYGLRTNEGARIVAELIYSKPETVQQFYKRGIMKMTFDYLELKLPLVLSGKTTINEGEHGKT